MEQWEYQVEQWTIERLGLGLNEMAAEGWEPTQILADWARQAVDQQDVVAPDWYTVVFRRNRKEFAR